MKSVLISLAAMVCLFATACESRFVEPKAEPVEIVDTPLDERLSQKAELDAQLQKIHQSASKLKQFVTIVKKFKGMSGSAHSYTPMDFLIELNGQLQNRIPRVKNGKLSRVAVMEIPVESLQADCRRVEAQVEAEPSQGTVLYSIRACGTENRFAPVFQASFAGAELKIKLVNENLMKVFREIVKGAAEGESACRVNLDDAGSIEAIGCENIKFALSESKSAYIKQLAYSSTGPVRLDVVADILEDGRPHSSADFILDGKLQFQSKPNR